jgi:hypothetical protein
LRIEFARVVVGAHCGLLTGGIWVKGENDFGCRIDRCRKHAVQGSNVVITESGATGCDGSGDPG